MPDQERASKKLWDSAAWRDAGFFLHYLRPHFNVFIPALIALALTGGLTVYFMKELTALVGKGLGGATGPEWMAELQDKCWFLVAIVGGGPGGLMAAEVLLAGGAQVDLYDAMPSVGRKFLLAGKGGLNLTHSEPLAAFVARYGAAGAACGPFASGWSDHDWRNAGSPDGASNYALLDFALEETRVDVTWQGTAAWFKYDIDPKPDGAGGCVANPTPSQYQYALRCEVRQLVELLDEVDPVTLIPDAWTAAGWFGSAPENASAASVGAWSGERDFARRYLELPDSATAEDFARELVTWAFRSHVDTVILPMQDILGLGREARMNRPGTAEGNWSFRLLPGERDASRFARVRELAETYGRSR